MKKYNMIVGVDDIANLCVNPVESPDGDWINFSEQPTREKKIEAMIKALNKAPIEYLGTHWNTVVAGILDDYEEGLK